MKHNTMVSLRGERPQREVAKAIGISRSYYTLLENGKETPSLKVAVRLADYFEVPVEALWSIEALAGPNERAATSESA